MTLKPSDLYYEYLKKHHLQIDPKQVAVFSFFDHLHHQLNLKRSFFKCLSFASHGRYKGVYLWGSVGIGKTFIMDCFFSALATERKRRIHFHAFMQEVHAQLQRYSGRTDPLSLVAKSISATVDVLCLDEFFVSDIVDAMVLARLLKALFNEGICFVTTSNIPPRQLYKEGLRRDNFLPAIDLLEKKLEIIHLASDQDYRLLHLKSAGVYYTPLTEKAEQQMEAAFQVCSHTSFSTLPFGLLGRKINVIKSCSAAIWFDYKVLCGEMRCKEDYLALAEQFPIVFLSHVPILDQQPLDEVTRFIQLVDIFYDAKIKLVISAAVMPHLLYTSGKFIFDFQRVASRLFEMQSADYLDRINLKNAVERALFKENK